jgi:hypothetical protein
MTEPNSADWGHFVSGDGIKSSVAWRLGPYVRTGILSDTQIAELSSRFGFTIDEVQELSRSLGFVLDPEAYRYPVPFKPSVARQRAARVMAASEKDILSAQVRISKALTHLQPVAVDRRDNPEEAKLLEAVWDHLRAAFDHIGKAQTALGALKENPNASLHMAPTDKRLAVDFRRQAVVFFIVYFLQSHGRDFGYTSHDRNADRRTGPLIDFVNAIVPLITDPPSTLKAETVIKDISKFRRLPDVHEDD